MNNREKGYIKEKIKTAVLVVLFLQTILLLYFFWQDITFKDIKFKSFLTLGENVAEIVPPEELIMPSHIDVCLDNDTYTRLDGDVSEYWSDTNDERSGELAMMKCVFDAMATGDEFVEEITAEQYEEVMGMLSAKAVFDYYLPYREYCTLLGITNPPGTEMIEAIGEIGFSAGSAESMFVYDNIKEKYYRIVSDFSASSFLEKVAALAADKNTSYYPLEAFVGTDLTSGVLIPQFMETDITEGTAYREAGDLQGHDAKVDMTEAGTEFARTFFSDTFDFVRRVEEENGRITYIYGYGEKILTIYENGRIEYRANNTGGGDSGYMNSLTEALSVIAELGGFNTLSGTAFTPYLSFVQVINEQGRTEPIYRFEFGMLLDGEKVYMENENVAVIEICGGQVSYFARNYIETPAASYRGNVREAHSAVNVLAQNYEYIYGAIMQLDRTAISEKTDMQQAARMTSDERFEFVASLISDMSIGYLFDEANCILKPCYVIELFDGAAKMYFDIETAEPITGSEAA